MSEINYIPPSYTVTNPEEMQTYNLNTNKLQQFVFNSISNEKIKVSQGNVTMNLQDLINNNMFDIQITNCKKNKKKNNKSI
jgi:hypothetical protein